MLDRFSAPVREWFSSTFGEPTPPQREGWPAIAAGCDTLICAPTGSGKTLAAFLWSIDELVRARLPAALADDDRRRLRLAAQGARQRHPEEPRRAARPRSASCAAATGVDAARDPRRGAQRRHPGGASGSAMLQASAAHPDHDARVALHPAHRRREPRASSHGATVIVDEIHAIARRQARRAPRPDARAPRRARRPPPAAHRPVGDAAADRGDRAPAGRHRPRDAGRHARLHDRRHRPQARDGPRDRDHRPGARRRSRRTSCRGGDLRPHRRAGRPSTARRSCSSTPGAWWSASRISSRERLGEGRVVAHHGSLSRATRLEAEQRLKSGEVPVVVATASLELGIDVGHVDLVCHLGSPRAIATLAAARRPLRPRARRGTPKGVLFPLTRDELVQCAARVRAVRAGELDRLAIPPKPLDILAQQIVADRARPARSAPRRLRAHSCAAPTRTETARARSSTRSLVMLAEGVATARGRRGALAAPRPRPRRRARRARRAARRDHQRRRDPRHRRLRRHRGPDRDLRRQRQRGLRDREHGRRHLPARQPSWRIRRVEARPGARRGRRRPPPTIPFWLGEAPARTRELSGAASPDCARRRRRGCATPAPRPRGSKRSAASPRAGAEQIVELHRRDRSPSLGTVPTADSASSPSASSTRAAACSSSCTRLRRRDQPRLGPGAAQALLRQLRLRAAGGGDRRRHRDLARRAAQLPARRASSRCVQHRRSPRRPGPGRARVADVRHALALERHALARAAAAAGRQARPDADPAHARRGPASPRSSPRRSAARTTTPGPIEPPDHPLVDETFDNCLHEAMDIDGSPRDVLDALERRRDPSCVAVETAEPSPMSHEILNANPYAFLDDAPLEERRARAVALRRVDPDLARGIGALDPRAIDEVRAQACAGRPRRRRAARRTCSASRSLPVEEAEPWDELAAALVAAGRVTVATWTAADGDERRAFVAAERERLARDIVPGATFDPPVPSHRSQATEDPTRELRSAASVQGWMACLGPATVDGARAAPRPVGHDMEVRAGRPRVDGVVLRGRFTPGTHREEWCERRLLARIHRLTIGTLRREIEPVSAADFMRFLLRWQHVAPGTQLHGREGLLAGRRSAAGPRAARAGVGGRGASRLASRATIRRSSNDLCLSGTVAWGRLTPDERRSRRAKRARRSAAPPRPRDAARLHAARRTPLIATPRSAPGDNSRLSVAARDVAQYLSERGASFMPDIADGTGRLPAASRRGALGAGIARASSPATGSPGSAGSSGSTPGPCTPCRRCDSAGADWPKPANPVDVRCPSAAGRSGAPTLPRSPRRNASKPSPACFCGGTALSSASSSRGRSGRLRGVRCSASTVAGKHGKRYAEVASSRGSSASSTRSRKPSRRCGVRVAHIPTNAPSSSPRPIRRTSSASSRRDRGFLRHRVWRSRSGTACRSEPALSANCEADCAPAAIFRSPTRRPVPSGLQSRAPAGGASRPRSR